jgi:phosphoglycolate phosphatase
MKDTVFFDLDGTLTDPVVGITRSIQYALERLGRDVPGQEDLKWCIGPPLLHSFDSLVGNGCAPQALDYYRERFSDVGWKENTLYPGISDTLTVMADSGLSLYVASSKPHVYVTRIIEHFDLGRYFNGVFGSELDGTRTDKAELLGYALSKTKTLAVATMIGDREHDVRGALQNGMRTIGVSYGYGSIEELESAGVHKIVGRHEDLLSHFGCH